MRLFFLGLAVVACGNPDPKPPRATLTAFATPAAEGSSGPDLIEWVAPETESPPVFLGEDERPILRSLREGEIVAIEKGRGGRSLGFRVRLADGTMAYFKPEQTFTGAHWYAEVASYELDRELGFGRVPPTVSRAFAWEPLRAVAVPDRRIREIVVQQDGTVRGALIAWIHGGIPPVELPSEWEQWIRVLPFVGVSPYQRAADFSLALSRPARDPNSVRTPSAPREPDRPAELSDMILFDYLTSNIDRWSADLTNVRTRGLRGPLLFFDNGAAFAAGRARNGLIDSRLHTAQRFRSKTVEALRKLDLPHLRGRMNSAAEQPVLDNLLFEDLVIRREEALRHIDECIERFGARALPW